jgi:hypothetical protein
MGFVRIYSLTFGRVNLRERDNGQQTWRVKKENLFHELTRPALYACQSQIRPSNKYVK